MGFAHANAINAILLASSRYERLAKFFAMSKSMEKLTALGFNMRDGVFVVGLALVALNPNHARK